MTSAPEPISASEGPEGVHGTVEAPQAVSGPQDASQPGIHAIPAERYHEDPSDQPSLSASIAHLMVNVTPWHAWWAHPKLNPHFEREEKQAFDIGTVAHELILEGTDERVHVVEASDWRKRDAQDERDQARADGLIPLLEKDWLRVERMVETVRAQLELRADLPPLLSDGVAEQTLVWEEGDVTCRARLDWLRTDCTAIDDLKTTGRSANPIPWCRNTLYSIGADVQAAFYLRGVKALTGQVPTFRWILAESTPPYAVSVVSPDASAREIGDVKVDRAIEKWRECLKTDVWPGWSQSVYMAETPAYEELRWMEQDGEAMSA